MVTDTEMNEFVKGNPEFAEEFYKQMKEKYSQHAGFSGEEVHYFNSDTAGVWVKDPLKFS